MKTFNTHLPASGHAGALSMRPALMRAILPLAAFLFTLTLSGCGGKESGGAASIAVFIPGIMADSPTYAHVAEGVQEAVDEFNAQAAGEGEKAAVYIMEAGTNQAEWPGKLTSLAATGKYDLIISSNPSLPEIAEPIAKQFPKQKFIFLDAALAGNAQVYTVSYNQRDQAYISGYMAGLYSRSHKVALVAAQEYPIMNNILYPYYALGASAAYRGTSCDFRIVGNWYDASKGAEITGALCDSGVDVILPICGGASQGVISAAGERGIHIVWFDENGFKKAPGTIISCCMTKQDKAAKEAVLQYLAGETPWGTVREVGFKEGYAEFFDSDENYIKYVGEDIRSRMSELTEGLLNGSVKLPASLK